MLFDDDRRPDGGAPVALLNAVLAAMASVHAMTGSAVAGVCAGGALLLLSSTAAWFTKR